MFENPLVAIDIGSHSIKVVEIGGTEEKFLIRTGIKTLPPGAIVNGIVKDKAVVRKVLVAALREVGVRKFLRRAALSISGSAVIIKRAKIIPSEEVDLAEQVFSEAESQFQTDMNELYFDYHLTAATDSGLDQFAVMVGTRRETINERVEIVRNAGLLIGCIDCDLFALTNIVERTYGEVPGIIAVMNIGAGTSHVVFIGNGQYLYSREVGLGGEFYTKGLADIMKVTFGEAEEHKLSLTRPEGVVAPEIAQALNDMHDQLINEFQMTVEFFFQSGEAPVDQDRVKGLFLCGGGAQVWGLTSAIDAKLQIPVRIMDPFETIPLGKKMVGEGALAENRAAFGIAAGIGLRRFGETE